MLNKIEVKSPYNSRAFAVKQQVSQWQTRLLCEYATSAQAFHLVLTYAPEHLPQFLPSRKSMSDFFKNLRRQIEYHWTRPRQAENPDYVAPTLKYFYCSENGDVNGRLHFHCILFFDTYIQQKFLHDTIEKCWAKGFIKLKLMQPKHAFYVTKYIQKKVLWQSSLKAQSQGLGKDYAVKNHDLILHNEGNMTLYGYKRRLTRYQKDRFFTKEDFIKQDGQYAQLSCNTHFALFDSFCYVDISEQSLNKFKDFLHSYYHTNDWPLLPDKNAFSPIYSARHFKHQEFIDRETGQLVTISRAVVPVCLRGIFAYHVQRIKKADDLLDLYKSNGLTDLEYKHKLMLI